MQPSLAVLAGLFLLCSTFCLPTTLAAQSLPRDHHDAVVRPPPRQLLLISLDGFRHDYLTLFAEQSNFLRRKAAEGVLVPKMQVEFVPNTYPNHWTMVTGLFQESHGILGNTMYDPVFDAHFGFEMREERWWNDSTPIWVTAKQQGFKTASLAWPGSNVAFDGILPDYFVPYKNKLTDADVLRTIVDWLAVDRVQLCTVLFNQPDWDSHGNGPESKEVGQQITRLSGLLERLMYDLQLHGLGDRVDVIITSDHGMSPMSRNRLLAFNRTAMEPYVRTYVKSSEPLLGVFAKPGATEQLAALLHNATVAEGARRGIPPPATVYTRTSLPQRFHYSGHRRCPDVLLLPQPGWMADASDPKFFYMDGHHGFDNELDDMKVPLIAFGPSFQHGVKVEDFRQVDVYGLACKVLGITPQANNGSSQHFEAMLQPSSGVALAPMSMAKVLIGVFTRVVLLLDF